MYLVCQKRKVIPAALLILISKVMSPNGLFCSINRQNLIIKIELKESSKSAQRL